MEHVGIIIVVLCVIVTCHAGCVEENKKTVEDVLNPLKEELAKKSPNDVPDFLCMTEHKASLDKIIKHFNNCTDFVDEAFIKELKHASAKVFADDLFHIKSANEFCKCLPTLPCLNEIDLGKMSRTQNNNTVWKELAEPAYICGLARKDIECVGNSMPTCTRYLQYKYNKTVSSSMTAWFDISSLEYAHRFAQNHCKHWPDVKHTCSQKRSKWYSIEVCVKYAATLKDDKDRMCGMRKCAEKYMTTCPAGDMEYFIDSVNVFAEHKLMTTPCQIAMATVARATVLSVLVSVVVALML
ncbi:uncharacterized protein LOC128219748 [Mya arenaria]|uniref:uncharacterized protein LOC128219748 n=1 Tax=Mya arenaria TaxID=6604 RepID=UPI0022E1063C|nr:uncharacterized protein LOC128219748 [Mya arenaria]